MKRQDYAIMLAAMVLIALISLAFTPAPLVDLGPLLPDGAPAPQ